MISEINQGIDYKNKQNQIDLVQLKKLEFNIIRERNDRFRSLIKIGILINYDYFYGLENIFEEIIEV